MAGDWLYRAETDPRVLEPHLAAIVALADSEKEALGFLPGKAFEEALQAKRIIAMIASRGQEISLAGYVLFSGVFPNAKVQQIAVSPSHRRKGICEALINQLVSDLERREYQLVKAAVASDLPTAQAFYAKQGFVARITRAGGAARGRQIIIRARELDSRTLVSLMAAVEVGNDVSDLGLMLKGAGPAPLFAIDLNVLFDVVKAPGRPRAPLAERVICAALGHSFRLTVANEFVVELERSSRGHDLDPVLALHNGHFPRVTKRTTRSV